MAVYLARRGHVVTLCPRRMEHALQLSSQRENRVYLPGIEFPSDLQIGREVGPALMEADFVFFACPSHALRKLRKPPLNIFLRVPSLRVPLPCARDWNPEPTSMPMR